MIGKILKAGFTILIVALLLRTVGWGNLLNALKHTSLPWLLGVYGWAIVVRIMQAFQMQLILGRVGYRLRVWRIFLANSLSLLYSLILPGDILASMAKWANLSAATGKKSVVLNAMIYNRLVLLIPPLAIGAVAVTWENPFRESFFAEILIALAIAALAIVVFIFHPRYGAITDQIIRKISNPFPQAISIRIEMVLSSLKAFRKFRLQDHLMIYLVGILSMSASFFVFGFATKAAGVTVPFIILPWVMALLLSARQFPVTLSNLGVREGILMAVLSPYGVELEKAFALGLIMFSGQILMALVGLSYQVALTFGLSKWKLDNQ